jgi:hypothetical protein
MEQEQIQDLQEEEDTAELSWLKVNETKLN